MALLIAFLVFAFKAQLGFAVFDIDKCMEELGCFDYIGPFYHPIYRPFAILPSGRDSINTTFRLYTRSNPIEPLYLDNRNSSFSLADVPFNAEDETKIIIHGFREGEGDWMRIVRDEYLRRESMNIITVDWSGGSGIPYTLAAANTRVVGAEIALLISKLQIAKNADLERFHLIGFSLGSHTAGYAGERLKGQIRRITALDPAGPMFEGMSNPVRLDPSDAKFVDAIHTDAKNLFHLSFGTYQSMGHIDFYPNNGHDQPGCPESYIEKVKVITIDAIVKGLDEAGEDVGCRHTRAYYLFIDSMKDDKCTFVGFPCKNYDIFSNGQCGTCGKDGGLCGVLGYEAERFQPVTAPQTGNKLFLTTGDEEPFCRYHYQVVIETPEDDKQNPFGINIFIKTVSFGSVNATFEGENGAKEVVVLSKSNQVFEPETNYAYLVASSKDLRILKSVSLTFTTSNAIENIIKLKWKVRNDLRLRNVRVVNMNRLELLNKSEETTKYCGNTNSLISGRVEKFYASNKC